MIRPRCNAVVFDFTWNAAANQFDPADGDHCPRDKHQDNDIPDLTKYENLDPPGTVSESTGMPLIKGALFMWDVSRQAKDVQRNPSLIPKGKFDSGWAKTLYAGQPKDVNTAFDFPADPVLGNDDTSVGWQQNFPHKKLTIDPLKAHSIGKLASYDYPSVDMANVAGNTGDKYETRKGEKHRYCRAFCAPFASSIALRVWAAVARDFPISGAERECLLSNAFPVGRCCRRLACRVGCFGE